MLQPQPYIKDACTHYLSRRHLRLRHLSRIIVGNNVVYPTSYGHFLHEILPRVVWLAQVSFFCSGFLLKLPFCVAHCSSCCRAWSGGRSSSMTYYHSRRSSSMTYYHSRSPDDIFLIAFRLLAQTLPEGVSNEKQAISSSSNSSSNEAEKQALMSMTDCIPPARADTPRRHPDPDGALRPDP